VPFSEPLGAQFERIVLHGASGLDIVRSLDGKSNDAVRANRYNLIGQYRFEEGVLRGFSVGVAWRHRARPFLNYGSATATGDPTVTSPSTGRMRISSTSLSTPVAG